MIRFIGDVHAKWEKYLRLIEDVDSIQVGDFGAGFREIPALPPSARFIRGNHDNPEICRKHSNWIKDGTVENNMMFVGGAVSIDKMNLTENVDWWADEEISVQDLYKIVDVAVATKPRIIISHDCPESIIPFLFPNRIPVKSRTQQALDVILELCQPDLYIFGHWHYGRDEHINGTRFICLDELSYIDVDLSNLVVHKHT